MHRLRTRRGWPIAAWGVAIVAAGIVLELADSVRESDRVVQIDKRVSDLFIDHRTPFLSMVARAITHFGSGWVLTPTVLIAVGALVYVHRRRSALIVAVSSAGVAMLVTVAKQTVGRPRPPLAGRLVSAHGLAFPSGHAAQSAACYGALAWLAWEFAQPRRVRILAAVTAASLTVAVGLSRVYLGVHWPSDVLSGWLLGIGVLAVLLGSSAFVAGPSAEVDVGS